MDFRKIQFGCADAQTEGMDYPELITHGYVNIEEVVDKALNTNIFLGYKGSGKSALSEHLSLSVTDSTIIDQQGLKDFPFKAFNKIKLIDENPMLRAKSIWRWVLSIKILNNLVDDSSSVSVKQPEVDNLISYLAKNGLSPIRNISDVVSHSTSATIKASMKFLEAELSDVSHENEVSFEVITNYVLDSIFSYKESYRHLVIIDDLDDILAPNGTQLYTIAALISAVKDLNRQFVKAHLPIKIIILCRTDMFELLPDPNKNKIKSDSSFSFSWYDEGVHKPHESNLVKLIDIRGRLKYPALNSVIGEFFPSTYKSKEIHKVLLDFTRHTPRDFIQLMNYIQKQCVGSNVTTNNITEGLKAYSSEYFIQEIKDEMTGYINRRDIEEVINIISTLRKREFMYRDLLGRIIEYKSMTEGECKHVLEVMYNCSAIGHVYTFAEDNSNRITFKYRNRNSTFTTRNKIILHQGLWQALNVNY